MRARPALMTAALDPCTGPAGKDLEGKIAFSSKRSGNTDILVVNADGTGMAKLTDHPATDDEPAWQPRAPRPPVTSPSAASPPLPATT